MTRELHHRWFTRLFVWQFVAAALFGANAPIVTEPWTNWNLLFFTCQLLLLFCAFRKLRRLEEIIAQWMAELFRRFER
jgi:hypothetical protein